MELMELIAAIDSDGSVAVMLRQSDPSTRQLEDLGVLRSEGILKFLHRKF